MVDTVNSYVLNNNGRRYVLRLTNESDGTGESAVTKIDVSTLTDANGVTASYLAIDRIEYSVWGFNYLTLYFDADTDDELAVLSGQGVMDWSMEGGFVDPLSTGTTGDIKLTTDGGADGSGYDITIWTRPKAS